jgi:hypothetical protein
MEKVGRWRLGDYAKGGDGELFEVIGFITDPAIVFRNVKTHEQRVEVSGYPNELGYFTRYARETKEGE